MAFPGSLGCLSRSSPTSHGSLAPFPNSRICSHSPLLLRSLALPPRGSGAAACSRTPLCPLLWLLSSSLGQQSCCAYTCISNPLPSLTVSTSASRELKGQPFLLLYSWGAQCPAGQTTQAVISLTLIACQDIWGKTISLNIILDPSPSSTSQNRITSSFVPSIIKFILSPNEM